MSIPTDRGYVVLTKEDDGTISVVVCAGLTRGYPTAPYAVHPHRSHVALDGKVKIVNAGRARHTTEVVEVSIDDSDTVHIGVPHTSEGFRRTIATVTSFPMD
jgi:hypothetical protein